MVRAAVLVGWVDFIGSMALVVAHMFGCISWTWTATLAPLWVPFVVWLSCCAMAVAWAAGEAYVTRAWRCLWEDEES